MLNALIGVVLVYCVLSIVVTAVVEWWQQWLGIRGSVLQQCVGSLLGLDIQPTAHFMGWPLRSVVQHLPLLGYLFGSKTTPHDDSKSSNALIRFYAHPRVQALQETKHRLPSYIQDEVLAEVVVEVLCIPPGAPSLAFSDLLGAPALLRDRVAQIEPLGCRQQMQELLARANGEPHVFLASVQAWAHQVNERATGWLKRKLMWPLFMTSLTVAVITNADTVRMFQQLTRDPQLQEMVVRHAQDLSGVTSLDEAICSDVQGNEKSVCQEHLRLAKRMAIDVSPLLGWEADPVVLAGINLDHKHIAKFFGLLITTFALMLGAPFWFDLLQKLVKLRSSLKPSDGPSSSATASGDGASKAGPDRRSDPVSGIALIPPAPPSTPDDLVFRPESTLLDAGTLCWLSRVAAASYFTNVAAIEQDLAAANLRLEQYNLDAKHSNTQFFLATRPDAAVLAFRGTEPNSLADWWTDAQIKMVECPWAKDIKVHLGFLNALEAVWSQLIAAIAELGIERPLWICGHSLGGALATLTAHRLLNDESLNFRERPTPHLAGLATFGQPGVGNADFSREISNQLGPRYWRVVHHRDPVPRVPPECSQGGVLIYADEFGRILINPARWLRLLDALDLPTDVAAMKNLLRAAVANHSDYTGCLFTAFQRSNWPRMLP